MEEKTGTCLLCGNYNFIVGCCVNVPDGNGNCQLAFGVGNYRWLSGDSNFNVGIGTTNPDGAVGAALTSKLSVGIVSAYQFYGDASQMTGAGFNPDADENLIAGTCAGNTINPASTTACHNVLLGTCAGAALDAGDDNIIFGNMCW